MNIDDIVKIVKRIIGEHIRNFAYRYRECVGYSDGSANQVFTLPHYPVINENDFILEVGGSAGWEQVTTFSGTNNQYILNTLSGTISFGDGTDGNIPTSGTRICASYWALMPPNELTISETEIKEVIFAYYPLIALEYNWENSMSVSWDDYTDIIDEVELPELTEVEKRLLALEIAYKVLEVGLKSLLDMGIGILYRDGLKTIDTRNRATAMREFTSNINRKLAKYKALYLSSRLTLGRDIDLYADIEDL